MIAQHAFLEALAAEHPRPVLFATLSGAHLYGFPSEDSDFDLRGVHLMSPDDLFSLAEPKETIIQSGVREGHEIDLVTHDARKFFNLMLKPNGYVLEQLFSPLVVHSSPEHDELRALGRRCITRHHAHHYLGFARNQWELFRKETPPRVKPLLYVYRVLLTGIHLMRTGNIEANLIRLNESLCLPRIADLIQIKSSGAEDVTLHHSEITAHENEYARLVDQLEHAGAISTLPDAPTARDGLDDMLIRLRWKTIQTTYGI